MSLRCVSAIIATAAIIFGYAYHLLFGSMPVPDLDVNKYWGPSSRKNNIDSLAIKPFKIQYSDAVINDLRRRLDDFKNTELTEPLEGVGFRYGFNKKKLVDIVNYWNDEYLPTWEERQDYLNSWPQFTTEIQGLNIHFIHVKGNHTDEKKTIPLLLLHSWPGSVREFYDLIPKLITANSKTGVQFDVVVPSLPGFGWSDGPSITGMGIPEMSVILRNLMLKLGYHKFLIQGGNWGAYIGSTISAVYPDNVIGYHSSMCVAVTPGAFLKGFIAKVLPQLFIPEEFESFVFPISDKWKFLIEESGYLHLQATKPDTIGIALQSNPVGLVSYILEKFSTWTNPNYRSRDDGGLDRDFSKKALLDNVMIYYLTNSITTSMRLFAEGPSRRSLNLERVPVMIPAGCARFRHDFHHTLDWQLEDKFQNLIHSTYHKNGGHFIAFQLPEVLYADFVNFVNKIPH